MAVEEILNRAGLGVRQEHFFRSNRNPRATKSRLMRALEGAGWAHSCWPCPTAATPTMSGVRGFLIHRGGSTDGRYRSTGTMC
jgi:hypothetical protein